MSKFTPYHFDCSCGSRIEFESDEKPGTLVPVTCGDCGKLWHSELPKDVISKVRRETKRVRVAILEVFKELTPRLTVRQIFYALTVKGVIPKTEGGYRQTAYHLGVMRKNGLIPFEWIADNTRSQIKPISYSGLDAALTGMQEHYRRDLWSNQGSYVEIWVEKDALAGVISPITREYDVPLYVARGYGSLTFIFEAAEAIKKIDKSSYIYHFGDFDPSGVDAAMKIKEGLEEHGAQIYFERVAVIESQIIQYDLPTRPTKRSDPRSKNWGNKPSVELDALPAPILRSLVEDCIERHIEKKRLQETKRMEQAERRILSELQKKFKQDQNSDTTTAHA